MTTGQLEDILNIAMLTPMGNPHDDSCIWGAPILLWGPPGIGKSGRVEQAGKACDLSVETLYLSTLQPEDLSGIPMPNGQGGATNFCTLPQVQGLTALGKGILFLDELTTARPAVQGAGLAVVYERMIAGKRLPGRVRVVGAANPPEDAAGGWNLALPMANRLLHLDVKVPTADEWGAWLLDSDRPETIAIEHGENDIRDAWGDCWPTLQGLAAGFIRKNSGMLYKVPAQGDKARGKAWASPRSWNVAARCMAAARCLDKAALGIDLLEASVGSGPCAEWVAWVAYADLPDPKDVLDRGWRVPKDRLDVAFAVLSSAIAFTLSRTDKDEQRAYVVKAYNVLAQAIRDGAPDLVLIPAKTMMRAGYTTKAGGEVEKVAKPIIAYLGEKAMANHA